MPEEKVEGLVVKTYGGFYYVQDHQGNNYACRLRGKIKGPVLAGDHVVITVLEQCEGILEQVLPRKNELYRPRVANVSLLLIVMAVAQPAPSLILLDRLLFLAAYYHVKPCIILNKCDLPRTEAADKLDDYYVRAGFKLIKTSATTGEGLEKLREILAGNVTVLAGPSGTGKSSLLNNLTGADMKTQEVSRKISRGRHTTRHVELFPLLSGGWMADSPGFSVIDLPSLDSRELAGYWQDFATFVDRCRFDDCLHYREQDCGIKQACLEGQIADFRYQNYVTILEEVMQNERCYR